MTAQVLQDGNSRVVCCPAHEGTVTVLSFRARNILKPLFYFWEPGAFRTERSSNMTSDRVPHVNPDQVLAELSGSGIILPETALRTAANQPAVMGPLLLERLREIYSRYDSISAGESRLEIYILFLMARFREHRVLSLVKAMLDKTVGKMGGRSSYVLPDGASRLFASWAFTAPKALRPFIKNIGYANHVRIDALESNMYLYFNQAVSRDYLLSHLRELASGVFQQTARGPDEQIWLVWANCCVGLALDELYPLVKTAFAREWISPEDGSWEKMKEQIAYGETFLLEKSRNRYGSLIDDVVGILRGMPCFSDPARNGDGLGSGGDPGHLIPR